MIDNILNSFNNVLDLDLSSDTLKEKAFEQISEKTGFNIGHYNEIVALQRELNMKIDPNWIANKLNWKLAINLETAELLDSMNWKWWKKGSTDWANIEIELIDLFHFILAKLIELTSTDALIPIIIAREMKLKKELKDSIPLKTLKEKEILLMDIMNNKFLLANNTENIIGVAVAWLDAWYLIGNDMDYLFKMYKMKYVLNNFRQDNGYKEGTYKKIWNGSEDNVVAQLLTKDIENNSDFLDTLYTGLKEYYINLEEEKEEEKTIATFVTTDETWKMFFASVPEENRNVMVRFATEYEEYLKS